MDRIIFGDNQFFGINHMSEDKAQALAERFRDVRAILDVVDAAYSCGVHAFMFNTHDKVAEICKHFLANPQRYADLRLYPSMPYAHKYANAVNEKGMIGALNDFLFAGRTAGEAFATLVRGGLSIVNRDMIEIMKLLVDAEMRMFKGLNVQAIFLQNIVSDLLLGMGARDIVKAFAEHVEETYGVDPGFNTMNMPLMVEFLEDCGISNPLVCSSINKAGYFMSPGVKEYEETLRTRSFRAMAMSVLASGAIGAEEAIAYVCGLPNVQSVVFGASSRSHIEETKRLILSHWRTGDGEPQRIPIAETKRAHQAQTDREAIPQAT
ncbi:MAG: hypothetical protein ABFE01_22060 [Phycisphaerales bacterium]|jgi:hypothetical protein